MKGTLEFDLTDHHDRLEHKRALTATNVYIIIHELDNHLRNIVKYEGEQHGESYLDGVEAARSKLHELLGAHGINMDDLE